MNFTTLGGIPSANVGLQPTSFSYSNVIHMVNLYVTKSSQSFSEN